MNCVLHKWGLQNCNHLNHILKNDPRLMTGLGAGFDELCSTPIKVLDGNIWDGHARRVRVAMSCTDIIPLNTMMKR